MNKPKIPKPIHLDPILYACENSVYSFTITTNNRVPHFLNIEFGKKIIECLKESRTIDNCYVTAYCLMPDHLHLIGGTLKEGNSVLTFIDRFKGRSTRIGWQYGIHGVLWQKRNYDHIIRDDEDLDTQVQYILSNPIRKEMVNKWEEYPLCGLLDPFPF